MSKTPTVKIDDQDIYSSNSNGIFYPVGRAVVLEYGYTCREEVLWECLERRGFEELFFKVKNNEDVKKVIGFINYFENLCKIPKKSRAQFAKTTKKNVLLVIFGKFWKSNVIRKDLFTALLRAGLCEGKNNAEKMKNCQYIDGGDPVLRSALDKFIKGYRNVNNKSPYDFDGWQNTFSEKEYHSLLRK